MPVETKEVETPNTDTTKIGAEGNDNFGAAFDEAAVGEVPNDKPAETQPEKDEGAEKVEETAEAEKKDEDTAEKAKAESKSPEAGAKKEDVAAEEETYEALKHKHDTLKGMFDKETKTLRDELKKLQEQLASKQDTPKPEPKSKKQEVDDIIAKVIEGNPKVKGYFDEYDYAAEPLRELLGEVIAEAKAGGSSNEESVKAVRKELHFMTIKMAHRDFADIAKAEEEGKPSKLEAFVKAYDGPDKDKILHAYTDGDAFDVIELVDAYKKSLEPPASTVVDEVKKKRDEKLADLSAVPKKDSAINTNTKKKVATYGEAFEEAASAK